MPRLLTRLARPVLSIALAATLVAACAVNPVSGTREFVLLSEAQEIELGRKNDPQIRREYGVYDDPRLGAYVQEVGERLARASHRPTLVYRFTVLDSADVNAFALPGGYIYITRGILAYLDSEAELAAVLGHEIGHVTARHAVRRYTAAVSAAIIAQILAPQSSAGQDLLNILGSALLAGYGREHELESDRLGAEYLARAGYDPAAMIKVIALLKDQEEFEKARAQEEGREPRVYHGVFASHPSADRRLQEVVAEAQRLRAPGPARVAREEYLRHLEGLVFGDSAREGVRVANRFYHRDMNLAVTFPAGWRLENRREAVLAHPRDRSALLQMQVEDLAKHIDPREYLRARLHLAASHPVETLSGTALAAATTRVRLDTPFGRRETRVSVVYHERRAFLFFGAAREAGALERLDEAFLASARSLRALAPAERPLAEGLRIHLHRARAGERFAELAAHSPLPAYPEKILRLLNGKFPAGEPEPGEWIKIVQAEGEGAPVRPTSSGEEPRTP